MDYTDLDLNLYSDDHPQGDLYYLTAYGRDEHDQLDTSNYITVEISKSDYRAFTDDDDWWCGSGCSEHEALMSVFILYLLQAKKAGSK